MDNKTLFLDIDHVLTNTDLDQTSFRLLDPSKYMLSKLNLKFLDMILAKTGAKIVIASNWRRFDPSNAVWVHGGKAYHSTLEPFKKMYSDYIIGMLPPDRHITKCEALELWFDDNNWLDKTNGKYAILEDDLREGYQAHPIYSKHLVLTDSRYGLTEEDAIRAMQLLG